MNGLIGFTKSGYTLIGRLAAIKRMADHDEISQRVYLLAFQLVAYGTDYLEKYLALNGENNTLKEAQNLLKVA